MLANKIDPEEYKIVNLDTGETMETNIRLVRIKNQDEIHIDVNQATPEDLRKYAMAHGANLHVNSHIFKKM